MHGWCRCARVPIGKMMLTMFTISDARTLTNCARQKPLAPIKIAYSVGTAHTNSPSIYAVSFVSLDLFFAFFLVFLGEILCKFRTYPNYRATSVSWRLDKVRTEISQLKMKLIALIVISFICLGSSAQTDELNDDMVSIELNKSIFRNLVRPFRMEKLNLIWVKAQQVRYSSTFGAVVYLCHQFSWLVQFENNYFRFARCAAPNGAKATIALHANEDTR